MLKVPSPVAELEKKNASAEPAPSMQEPSETRPETDFHFFSDTEVTKYVTAILDEIQLESNYIVIFRNYRHRVSPGIKILDPAHRFSRTRSLKCEKSHKTARKQKIKVFSRAGDGVNCLVYHRKRHTRLTEIH